MGNGYNVSPVTGVTVGVLKMVKTTPAFGEVHLVENLLQEKGLITKEALQKKLRGEISQNKLNQILTYFEHQRYIYVGRKGISWIVNDNPKFRKVLEKSIAVR